MVPQKTAARINEISAITAALLLHWSVMAQECTARASNSEVSVEQEQGLGLPGEFDLFRLVRERRADPNRCPKYE